MFTKHLKVYHFNYKFMQVLDHESIQNELPSLQNRTQF